MVKGMLLDVSAKVPPPYIPPAAMAGFVTVTDAVPAVAMAEAGIVVISWVPVATGVVVCDAPFQLMVALLAKLVPFTVRVKAALPEFILAGASWVMFGIVPAVGVVAFEL